MVVIAESATTLVRLHGRFDSPRAHSIAELLSVLGPLQRVVVDFANVREVDDAAVANLARALGASPGSRVTFRGLSRHLRRLLRYLGVETGGLPDREQEPEGEDR